MRTTEEMSVSDMKLNFRRVLEKHKHDLCQEMMSKETNLLEKLIECGLVKLEEVEMMLSLADRKIIENIFVNILSRHSADGIKKFCSGTLKIFDSIATNVLTYDTQECLQTTQKLKLQQIKLSVSRHFLFVTDLK